MKKPFKNTVLENSMKVLNSVIKFGNAFSGLNKVAQSAVVGALIFVAFTMGNCNGKSQLDTFNLEYKEFKNNAERTGVYADSLKAQVAELTDEVMEKDDTIKQLNISLSFKQTSRETARRTVAQIEERMTLPMAPPQRDTVRAELIDALKTQLTITDSIVADQHNIITTQKEKIVLLDSALTLAMTRGDSLQAILITAPKPVKNPDKFFFGLLPKPNRKVVGVVSLAAGIVIGSKL